MKAHLKGSFCQRLNSRARQKWPHILLTISLCVFTLIVIFKFIALDWIVDRQITEKVRLIPGSDTWKKWVNVPVPVFLKFRLFNVTNPDEVQNGGKPNLKEVGPYVYEERRFKNILAVDEERDTITYNQQIFYHFRQDLSTGKESDRVILINIPFVAVAKLSQEMTNLTLAYGVADRNLRQRGERLFMFNTVKEYLFDGFSVQPYISFLSNPLLQLVGRVSIPESFEGGRFGFYKGRNGSDDGEFIVRSGKTDVREFGSIVSWNGKTRLEHWEGGCNLINGTDGSILHPFITKKDILRFFVPDICRSMLMVYYKEVEYQGIKGFRFKLPHPKGVFDHPNFCFCPKKKGQTCYKQGVFSLSPCREGAPVSFSAPHFFQSWEPYLTSVKGLNPTQDLHDTFIDIEPKTGLVMRATKRLQFNIQVEPNVFMPTFSRVPNVLLPFMWIEEQAELTQSLKNEVKEQLVDTVELVNKASMGGLVTSAIMIVLGLVGFVIIRFDRSTTKSLHSDDEDEKSSNSLSSVHSSLSNSMSTISRSTMTSENKATMTEATDFPLIDEKELILKTE